MDILAFRARLVAYLRESGVSQNELSKLSGVPQSQISGWVHGGGRRFGKNNKKVMEVIEAYYRSSECPIPDVVAVAVREFCGGSKEKAEILAEIIFSLRVLIGRKD